MNKKRNLALRDHRNMGISSGSHVDRKKQKKKGYRKHKNSWKNCA